MEVNAAAQDHVLAFGGGSHDAQYQRGLSGTHKTVRAGGNPPLLRSTQVNRCAVLGRQLLGFGTSVGAHYREARRAKSTADFVSKMEGALQELDETAYWLELLRDAELVAEENVDPLTAETDELISIFVSVVRRTKEGRM